MLSVKNRKVKTFYKLTFLAEVKEQRKNRPKMRKLLPSFVNV